ncbi:MAG TPA: hypothetical protein EYP10_01910, partial [Armatimonadetes bacterium]|nr:hypothetical protein [Armatimonadota bacterium]
MEREHSKWCNPHHQLWLTCFIALWQFIAIATPSTIYPNWRFKKTADIQCASPNYDDSDWALVKVGHKWRGLHDAVWLRTIVVIPEELNGMRVYGKPVGMRISCGSAGEIFVNGRLQQRYDNDHPGLALLTERAIPGARIAVAIRAWTSVEREEEAQFHEATLVLLNPDRVCKPLLIRVDASERQGQLPRPFAGISQGGA